MNTNKLFFSVFIIIYFIVLATTTAYGMQLTKKEKIVLYKAQQQVNKNDIEKSQEIISEYLKKHQDKTTSPELYLFLGNSYYDRNNYKQAKQAYFNGLQNHPNNTSLIVNYAVSSYRNQDYQEAGVYFKKAYFAKKTTQNPDQQELLFKSATAFYRAEQLNKSKKVLTEVFKTTDQPNEKWLKLLIRINYELKEWKQLENNINNYLKIHPEQSTYWQLLAQTYLEQEKYVKAASILEIVHNIFPTSKKDWKQLANLYLYIDDPEGAAKALERGFGQNPDPKECERLAKLYFRSLHYQKALSYINKALQKEETAKRYFMKGEFYYRNREYKKALQAFQESLRLDPKQGKTHLFLGFAANEVGNWSLAKKSFQKASQFNKYKKWAEANVASIEELLTIKNEG